ncbi:unnamed protein product [Diamesa hyperborea]
MKKVGRVNILDRLHRGVVYTCLGLTAYGTYLLGVRAHRYFTVTKPRREEAELRMLMEAKPVIDSETMVDHVPKLRG